MAKKSAKSKGYRKTIKKKPFLTKKEIIELIVVLAVLALAVILFNIFYDDGFVKTVQDGEIATYASTELRDRYKKVGDIGTIEGYTLQERDASASPLAIYTFLPDDENSEVSSVSVNGSFMNAADLVATTLTYMQSAEIEVTEILPTTIQGYDALVYAYNYSEYVPEEDAEAAEVVEEAAEEAAEAEEAEEPAHNKFNQSVSTYIAVDDTHTLCLHIYRTGADESVYLAQEELLDYVAGFESAFTVIEKE